MKANKTKLIWAAITVLYFAVMGFLCFYNFPESDEAPAKILGIPMDKIVHFLMFLPFPVVTIKTLHRSNGKAGRFFLFAFLMYSAGLIAAAGIEVLQSMTGYRTGDVMDFVADSAGLSLSTLFVVIKQAFTQKW